MLLHSTDIAGLPLLDPGSLALALSGRHAIVLAPASDRGWFGGRAIVAWDPIETHTDLALADAGALLQTTFDACTPGLMAVLAPYEGACTAVRYSGGLIHAEGRWRSWGAMPAFPSHASDIRRVRTPGESALPLAAHARGDVSARDYRAGITKVRDRIAAGDVYVLNLTYRMWCEGALEPAQSFAALLDRAASDFSALFELPSGGGLASASPERFLRVRIDEARRIAEICPIKGTRPRGASSESDAASARELLGDAKERAEHIMVVDLERNDLGRVCVPGTVRVDPLYEVVPTPYCHQLVSTVRGELRSDVGFGEVLQATFPCGSVTGAPKMAAMRIISELECSARDAYCGALLVAMPGEMDSSVLIRTLEYAPDERVRMSAATSTISPGDNLPSRKARWGTGCGVTIESDPAAEWLESLLKATPVTGDGVPEAALLETCRIAYGRVPLIDRHLARLASGGCGPSLLALVRERVAAALGSGDRFAPYGRLRVIVHPDRRVETVRDARPSALSVDGGPVLVPHLVRRPPGLPGAAAKPAARAVWDEAHAAAVAEGGHQAVLVGPDGAIIDGSTASVWVRSGGALLTPPAPPAVDGVGRGLVFDVASEAGYAAREAALTQHDLAVADEVFLSNALAGVVAVRGRSGPVCLELERAFARVWTRR